MRRSLSQFTGFAGGCAILCVAVCSCTAPAKNDPQFEPIPQDQFQRCAAEFAAKREYCGKKYGEGSTEHVDCVNAAMAGWNECASGKKTKRIWSWLPSGRHK